MEVYERKSLDELLSDFPPGPLDAYRKKATFQWKKLKLFIEGEDELRFKVCILEMFLKKKVLCTN